MFSKETYMQRRALLKRTLGSGVLSFLGNDECGLNYEDSTLRYRRDSIFLYYFNLSFAELSAVIDIDEDKEIIFDDELTIGHIVRMGTQPTPKEKSQRVGVSITMSSMDTISYLHKTIQKDQAIRYLPPHHVERELKLVDWLGVPPARQGGSMSFVRTVITQCNYKSVEEVVEIEKVCDITTDMHITAMRTLRLGMHEWEMSAAVEAVAHAAGGDLPLTIIATVNGQTLRNHYHGNTVRPDDLFLIDTGAEMEMGCAGDMSPTIPTDRKFMQRQREVYKIQSVMHLKSVKILRPGIPYMDVHDLSAHVMVEGLKGLGLMKGSIEDALREGAHALFYPHKLEHMMGLDAHDVENLGEPRMGYNGQPKGTQFGRKSRRLAVPLEPGFVHTAEPDIYSIPELIDLWKGQRKSTDFINYDRVETYKSFGGIRSEEDYLITETGAHRLGKKIPLTPDEVEVLK